MEMDGHFPFDTDSINLAALKEKNRSLELLKSPGSHEFLHRGPSSTCFFGSRAPLLVSSRLRFSLCRRILRHLRMLRDDVSSGVPLMSF